MLHVLLWSVLALALGALVCVCLASAWHRPWLGLPILVAGMAFHNTALMLLLSSGVPAVVIRSLQFWKEILLALLWIRLAWVVVRSGARETLSRGLGVWRTQPVVVRLLDVAVAAFAVLTAVYAALPDAFFPGTPATLMQRLTELRLLGLIPVLYVLGRVWPPPRARPVLGAIIAVGVAVTAVGLVELWFIPTRNWIDFGILRFDAWLGYSYDGPGGLPENFFQSTTAGVGLRRMVSTYLSPLGVAYTGLLVAPVAFVAAVAGRRPSIWAWLGLAFVLAGIGLSLTRLALLCLLVQAAVMVLLLYRARALLAFGMAVAAVGFAFLVYPNYGPLVSPDLSDARPPMGAEVLGYASWNSQEGSSTSEGVAGDIVDRMVTGEDESIRAHADALARGLQLQLQYPFGQGFGRAVFRYGPASGPRESALFQIGSDLGLLGLLVFSALYGGLVLLGFFCLWRFRGDPARAALVSIVGPGGLALVPIILSSQVWGDFSVTFLFWWAAGATVTRFGSSLSSRRSPSVLP